MQNGERYEIYEGVFENDVGRFRIRVVRRIEAKRPLFPSREHDSLRNEGQRFGERRGSLARRRYQKGRVFLRGKNHPVWVGRWREDEIRDGRVHRVERSEVLGSKSDFPTKRMALRELEKRLTVVNDPRYRARPTATFAEFASRWESIVLTQHKPSTQITIRSHLRKHLVPYFERCQMREIGPEEVQRFVSSVGLSAKTAKNLFASMQKLWKSARTWGYVAHKFAIRFLPMRRIPC